MPTEFYLWPLYVLTLAWGLNSAGNTLIWFSRIARGIASLLKNGISPSISIIERRLMRKAFAKFFYEPFQVPTDLNYLYSVMFNMAAAVFGLALIVASSTLLQFDISLKAATVAISVNVWHAAWIAMRSGTARSLVARIYTEIKRRYPERPGWKNKISLAGIDYDTRRLTRNLDAKIQQTSFVSANIRDWGSGN